jgi:hypothetical protein
MFRFKRLMLKSWWVWGALSAIAVMSAILLHHTAQVTALPDSVRSCLPSNAKFELLAQVQQGNITYYLVGLNGGNHGRNEEVDTLIQVRRNQCQPLPLKRLAPLNSVVTLKTAKQLELQRYQLWVRQYGKANFQRFLDAASPIQPLAPEVQWALHQLDLRVPEVKE